MKAMLLATMILGAAFVTSVNKSNRSASDFKGGAVAALAGAYTNDHKWVVAGGFMMDLSLKAGAIPGMQGAAMLGFL